MSKFCDLNANIKHIGEVSTSRVDGSPTGAKILTSTNGVTGDVRDTLDGKFKQMDQQFQDRFNTLAPITWTPKTLIKDNQSLQVFEHDGLFYLPNVKKLPFTTGAVFNADNWVLSELMTQIKHWRDVGDVRGWGAKLDGITNDYAAVQQAVKDIYSRTNKTAGKFSKFTNYELTFDGDTCKINGTILTLGSITFKSRGCLFISDNDNNTPMFDSAKIVNNEWVSNDGDDLNQVLGAHISNLKFKSLVFQSVRYAIRMNGCFWGTAIKECTFYDVGRAVKADQCFYATYEDIDIKGRVKEAYFTDVGVMEFGSNTNLCRFINVNCGALYTKPTADAQGIGLDFKQGLTACVIKNSEFGICGSGIRLAGKVNQLEISDIFCEEMLSLVKSSDDTEKRRVTIKNIYSHKINLLCDVVGFVDSYIEVPVDTFNEAKCGVKILKSPSIDTSVTLKIPKMTTWRPAQWHVSGGVIEVPYNDVEIGVANLSATGDTVIIGSPRFVRNGRSVTVTAYLSSPNGIASGTVINGLPFKPMWSEFAYVASGTVSNISDSPDSSCMITPDGVLKLKPNSTAGAQALSITYIIDRSEIIKCN